MRSNRPYLVRAFHQWIVDSACTPIIVIDAHYPKCKIPMDFVEGGEIVFNVSDTAVRDLKITNEAVEFKASFSGVIHLISAPMNAVLAVYAEENGEGLFLDAEEGDSEGTTTTATKLRGVDGAISDTPRKEMPATSQSEVSAGKNKPFLTLVE
jgi:stringent starvation protein B